MIPITKGASARAGAAVRRAARSIKRRARRGMGGPRGRRASEAHLRSGSRLSPQPKKPLEVGEQDAHPFPPRGEGGPKGRMRGIERSEMAPKVHHDGVLSYSESLANLEKLPAHDGAISLRSIPLICRL